MPTLSASGFHLHPVMLPFEIPSLTFNKLCLHPRVLQWGLPMGHKEFVSLWSQTAPDPLIVKAQSLRLNSPGLGLNSALNRCVITH
jgi:hypothetical protein